MPAAQNELPFVQTGAELVLNPVVLLTLCESLKLVQLACRPQVRDNVQLPHLATLLQLANKLSQILHMVACIQVQLLQRCLTLRTTVLPKHFPVGVIDSSSSRRNVDGSC